MSTRVEAPLETARPTHREPRSPEGDAAVLRLSDQTPFGVGGRRLCFAHPHDLGKCVKVLRQDERRTVRHSKSPIPTKWRREYDNNAHERQILEQLWNRIGPEMADHLPRCYGMIDTDLGPGMVLDLVRDHDGRISRSLRELITLRYDLDQFRPAFEQLGEYLLKHVIITRAILDHNLAMQDNGDGTWRMVIIDGLGDPAWIPLASWIPSIGRAKIRKRLAIAWPRFEKFYARGGVSEEMIATSSWGQGILNHRGC